MSAVKHVWMQQSLSGTFHCKEILCNVLSAQDDTILQTMLDLCIIVKITPSYVWATMGEWGNWNCCYISSTVRVKGTLSLKAYHFENLQAFLPQSSLRASVACMARKAEGTMAQGSFFLSSTCSAPKQAARPLTKCLILSLTCKLMSHSINYSMASHRSEAQQRVERTGVCCGLWSTDPSDRIWSSLNLESPFPGRIFQRLCR